MAIIKKSLGNDRRRIFKKFREIFSDGEGGLRFDAFCEGWKAAWNEKGDKQAKQIKKLETELEQHRWISVSERLPEGDVDCLCFEGKFAGLGCYQRNSDTLQMQWQVNGFVSKRVTHWKPIILPALKRE